MYVLISRQLAFLILEPLMIRSQCEQIKFTTTIQEIIISIIFAVMYVSPVACFQSKLNNYLAFSKLEQFYLFFVNW